ncbi:MAG: hypothetical protein LBK06_03925 [Planctomycetaceae bacterium]|jgi:hypothetical protein|nr:hypothetical protein [Planctomycetaceae bacterium]
MKLYKICIGCFLVVVIFLSDVLLAAEQFRIDNEITAGKLVARSKTYFLDDDFLSVIDDNGEITYYNAERDTFTLINPSLRIQTQLSAYETRREIELTLDKTLKEEKKKEKKEKDGYKGSHHQLPLVLFIANPVFKIEQDPKSGQIALQSDWVEYKLTTEIFNDNNIAKRYFDFCNLTCYLNCRINNSYRQLYRLEVNRILRNKNRFPQNISVTFYPLGKSSSKFVGETLNSSHKLIRRLTEEDKNKINSARNSMNTFKAVTFDKYQKTINEEIVKQKDNEQQKK